jgi:uncharacterized membrane protein
MKTKSENKERSGAVLEREFRQLTRLERLIDVVFALMIVALMDLLPNPTTLKLREGRHLLDELFKFSDSYSILLIGLILIIIYWGQSNAQVGNLARTDGRHASLNIISLFFLLLYLYFVRLGEGEFKNDIDALALQSIMLALAGFTSAAAWRYARKGRRLLSEAISDQEAQQQGVAFSVEPITAVISLPFAFVSPLAWTLSWLLAIPLGWLLRRRLPKEEAIIQG